MKAWQIGSRTGIGGLQLADHPEPEPGADEILVKVSAAGLNYRDLMVLRGDYGTDLPEDRVPLSDGVGVIEAVGADVTGLDVGTRVMAPHFATWLDGAYSFAVFARDLGVTVNGWLAEKIILPANAAVTVPENVSDNSAATFSVVGSTVWHAMMAFGEAKPGDLVLAQGTGGVSIFALQLAKAMGMDFAITSSSDEKLARAREMGADYGINYRDRPDWGAALLEATGGRGADVVVDTLGFPAMGETVAACAVNARIGSLGALSGTPQDQSSASQGALIGKNIAIKGIASGNREMLQQALDVVAKNDIELLVESVFDFNDAPAAYTHLESGSHMGKIMITV
ncbi:NAD(P)-dependent alcohol dehydrogenase [Sphingorhabdus sp. EL138]|jgi:NADPH:quinone reductase-like Zn-dependent oxidoreductase|uniref:zinc-dependent alcohol dehydrogenase family protein n=1 Tax=Sphingorhabdus sp. EL138 TaxID=2073156 RepID=UPI000D69ADA6|nr:NAD(P)-dependent alcohol dehydrogenase [Sphingorhabdus sp. EL138]